MHNIEQFFMHLLHILASNYGYTLLKQTFFIITQHFNKKLFRAQNTLEKLH